MARPAEGAAQVSKVVQVLQRVVLEWYCTRAVLALLEMAQALAPPEGRVAAALAAPGRVVMPPAIPQAPARALAEAAGPQERVPLVLQTRPVLLVVVVGVD